MKRIFSSESINVFQLKLNRWPYKLHTHNFYEIILIEEGDGRHVLNDVSFAYRKGHVFLLTPEDNHIFEINRFTVFTYIKFTEQLFLEKSFMQKQANWIKVFKEVLNNPNAIPEGILSKRYDDQKAIFALVNLLLIEFKNPKRYSRQLIVELFGCIMVIVARNLSEKNTTVSKITQIERNRVNRILSFARQHIHDRGTLTRQRIAAEFQLSPGYVSTYLKKHTGTGLQQMVNETRLRAAERLLKQSTLTINQIADRTGFSDASHMNKLFNKYRAKNPTAYRKEQ